MKGNIIQMLCLSKIIAIIRGLDTNGAIRAAKALHDGGIQFIEVALSPSDDGKAAAEAIHSIREQIHDVYVGAGTVLTKAQLDLASQAGAQYIISPNVNTAVIEHTKEKGLISIPGALTASEAMRAYEAGADFIKLFPAAAMGPDYLKALKAPLKHLRFIAVGGIDDQNAHIYLNAGAVGIGVGGKLVNNTWIKENKYDNLTKAAQSYVQAVNRKE